MLSVAFVIGLLWKLEPQGRERKPLRFFYAVRFRPDGTSPPGGPRGSYTERREKRTCDTLVP